MNQYHIVFENEHLILVDKPVNWLSTPGRDPQDTRPVLGLHLQEQLKTQIFPIHRLDAEVSGLILYAKEPLFHKAANTLFEQRLIHKTYQALTPLTHHLEGSSHIWKSQLLRGKKRAYEAPYGKPAETHAQLLHKNKTLENWHLNPVTGRAHQLRFELYKQNAPILGDTLYGSQVPWPTGGIALRAIKINMPDEFAHTWKMNNEYQVDELPF